MNKINFVQLIKSMKNINLQNNEIYESINNLFLEYDIDNDGLLSFEDLNDFYLNSVKINIDNIWRFLYTLGYNNLLEKNKEIDYYYILNNEEEFEISKHINKIQKISKEKIYKLSLFDIIDKIFLQYFNNNQIFQNLKKIDISIYCIYQMVNLNIICPNIEILNLKITKDDLIYIYELNNIFPNINILNLFIETKFNLLRIFINSKIETLKINIDDYYVKIDSKIVLKNIKHV